MRNHLILRLLLLLLFPPLNLLAATIQLPQTGQTSCWDSAGNEILCTDPLGTRQDGAMRAGVAWPKPRFTDNGNGTVTDNLTDLIWLKQTSCLSLVAGMGSALPRANTLSAGECGLSDGSIEGQWRLPNVVELASLIDYGQSNPTLPLGHPFTGVSSTYPVYCSSSYGGLSDSLNIDFRYGKITTSSSALHCYPWPVRGSHTAATIAPLPKTGRTDSHGTADDGALQKGVAWPSPRFVDNNNGTVTDNLTGLIWLKSYKCTDTVGGIDRSGITLPWESAILWSNALANGKCGLSDSSIEGQWRLPNSRELFSLLNLPSGNPFQAGASYQGWTSDTDVVYRDLAVRVSLEGPTSSQNKSNSNGVWPVRGGTFSLSITKVGTGTGNVVPDSGSLSWSGTTGTENYAYKTVVTLTAQPSAGSTFAGWSGDYCAGTGVCSVTMGRSKSVTATFNQQPVAIPASINVPVADADGMYTVSWGVSSTAGASYQLQEATNSAFTANLRIISAGTTPSTTIIGRSQNVSYFYRVRAIKTGYAASAWRTAVNNCAVPGAATAGVPASITLPAADADGAYAVSWGTSATVGAIYELQEATASNFTTGLRTAYRGTAKTVNITGRSQNVTYYYRVRAVKAGQKDSGYRAAINSCAVPGTATTGVPASITVPVSDVDGTYAVSWGASATGGVTYELQEATSSNFSTGLRNAYRGTARTVNITGRSQNVTYYYRVRAVKGGFKDSSYRVGGAGCPVPGTATTGVPASLSVPTSDTDGAYAVSWGVSGTTGVIYELQEATNNTFTTGPRLAYRGTARTFNINGRVVGKTYYYRVRAVKGGLKDSGFRNAIGGCRIGP